MSSNNDKLHKYYSIKREKCVDQYNKQYTNEYGTWLDPIIPGFILLLNAILFFIECILNTIKPLTQKNTMLQHIFKKLFSITVFIIDLMAFGIVTIKHVNDSCISKEQHSNIEKALCQYSEKINDIYINIKCMLYDINKDEIDELIEKEMSDEDNKT